MNSPKTKGGDPRQSQKTELEGPPGQEPHEGVEGLCPVITGPQEQQRDQESRRERRKKGTQTREESAEGRNDSWRRKSHPIPVFLPGESPWTEEPEGLQSMGLHRVRHD